VATIAALVRGLDIPVIVKETGCGLSREAAQLVAGAGVTTVDVSGAGGTSWVAVEARRAAADSAQARLGTELWDWGIPTAVSVAACVAAGLDVIATGGLRSGHDIARALALGARAGGMAAPVLRAQRSGGFEGALAFLQELITSVRTVALLSGCAAPTQLAAAPRHIGGPLRSWLDDLGLRQDHLAG
jgi:isopentenyl-diphosphate delta-isomerase